MVPLGGSVNFTHVDSVYALYSEKFRGEDVKTSSELIFARLLLLLIMIGWANIMEKACAQ